MKRTLAASLVAGAIAAAIGWVALAVAQSPPAPVAVQLTRADDPPLPRPVLPGQPGAVGPVQPRPLPTPIMPSSPALVVQTAAQTLVGPDLDASLVLPVTTVSSGSSEKPAAPAAPGDFGTPTGRQESSVVLEWIGSNSAQINQASDYSLVIRNVGQSAVHQVQARVRLAGDVTVLSSEPKAMPEGSALCWDIGMLLPNQERHVQLRLATRNSGDFAADAWVTITNAASLRVRVGESKPTGSVTTTPRIRP